MHIHITACLHYIIIRKFLQSQVNIKVLTNQNKAVSDVINTLAGQEINTFHKSLTLEHNCGHALS